MIRNVKHQPYKSITESNKKYIPTGFCKLDEALNDLVTGTVTIINGRPADGKSTVVHQIIVNAIDKGFKTLIVDGEHDQEMLINKLYKIVIGGNRDLYRLVQCNKKYLKEPKPNILEMLKLWHDDRLCILSKHTHSLQNFEALFSLIELSVKAELIDFIVLDNLMSLIDSTSAELNASQSKFMKRCTTLAKAQNVAIILVAHPNKTAQKGKEIDYFQISGNSDLANLADNIFQVIKNPTDDKDGIEADGRIVVQKNRYYGDTPSIDLVYDTETNSLLEIVNGEGRRVKLDWRREGTQNGLDGI